MLAEALLDNRRQEMLKAFVHLHLGLLSATIWRQTSALLLDLDHVSDAGWLAQGRPMKI